MAVLTMHPKTDATVTIDVTATDPVTSVTSPVTTATLLGTFFDFNGKTVVANQAFTNLGAGKYSLTIPAAWTADVGGNAKEGKYRLEVEVTHNATQFTDEIYILVKF